MTPVSWGTGCGTLPRDLEQSITFKTDLRNFSPVRAHTLWIIEAVLSLTKHEDLAIKQVLEGFFRSQSASLSVQQGQQQ